MKVIFWFSAKKYITISCQKIKKCDMTKILQASEINLILEISNIKLLFLINPLIKRL